MLHRRHSPLVRPTVPRRDSASFRRPPVSVQFIDESEFIRYDLERIVWRRAETTNPRFLRLLRRRRRNPLLRMSYERRNLDAARHRLVIAAPDDRHRSIPDRYCRHGPNDPRIRRRCDDRTRVRSLARCARTRRAGPRTRTSAAPATRLAAARARAATGRTPVGVVPAPGPTGPAAVLVEAQAGPRREHRDRGPARRRTDRDGRVRLLRREGRRIVAGDRGHRLLRHRRPRRPPIRVSRRCGRKGPDRTPAGRRHRHQRLPVPGLQVLRGELRGAPRPAPRHDRHRRPVHPRQLPEPDVRRRLLLPRLERLGLRGRLPRRRLVHALADLPPPAVRPQPAEGGPGVSNEALVRLAAADGVDADISRCMRDRTYDSWFTSHTQKAFALGIRGTPGILINGRVHEPTSPADLRRAVANAMGG
ncbi:DsbA family protein [Gordonia sp. (in: high G+C Gram-positive bacteria)]|uniref:DsbA family protein n=1 Tax=Gordonia sp. (in: high G+C Gram-positive bacteria) TaxID=84139 RepID=UPI0039E4A14C